jgi:dUTP pyrophosphatase
MPSITPDFEPPKPMDETMDADPLPDDTTARIAPRIGKDLRVGTPMPRPSPFVPVGAQAEPDASLVPSASPPNDDRVVVHMRRVGQIRVPMPAYQTALAAGMDLVAAIDGPLTIAPLARVLVPTGIAIALPAGFEGQVRPRSGLAWSRGLTILNSPGTIDADYRGEIKVLLVNLGSDAADVMPGERIAQLVIARHARAELKLVEVLDETKRGAGGYGSTGT